MCFGVSGKQTRGQDAEFQGPDWPPGGHLVRALGLFFSVGFGFGTWGLGIYSEGFRVFGSRVDNLGFWGLGFRV